MPEKLDLTGQVFGHLKIIRSVVPKNGRTAWECLCSCGKIRVVLTDSLRKGYTRGCGSCGKIKHGLEGSPWYRRWSHIKERCYSQDHKDYPRYGGRGIKMQEDWINDPMKFKNDIIEKLGDCPGQGFSLDRIDNNGGYTISNLRWASRSTQQRNKGKMKNSSSKYRGVYVDSRGYIRAAIRENGKVKQLGNFKSQEEAAQAYDMKAKELRGADARLNFPD